MKVKVIRVVSDPKNPACMSCPEVASRDKVITSLTTELGQYVEDAQEAKRKIEDLEAQRDAARLQLDATKQALEKADATNRILLEECRKLREQLDDTLQASACKPATDPVDRPKIPDNVVAYIII